MKIDEAYLLNIMNVVKQCLRLQNHLIETYLVKTSYFQIFNLAEQLLNYVTMRLDDSNDVKPKIQVKNFPQFDRML